MKLKPIFASTLMLALVSGPAMAAAYDASVQPQLDAMRAKVAKMEAVIEQNQSGGFQQSSDWYNRITLSGQANVDGMIANRSPVTFTKGYTSGIILNNANLYVDALMNDWTKFHGSFLYQDKSATYFDFKRRPVLANEPVADEAYVTIGNFARSPFYFRAGRQYVDFGNYERYPMVNSVTQLLSQTRGTAATVGFIHPMGFNASAFLLDGSPRATDPVTLGVTRKKVRNFGGNIGFANSTDWFGYKLNVNYIRNMADVNFINALVPAYNSPVGGLGANVELMSGPFDAAVRYVTALQKFSPVDARHVSGGIVKGGAKPAALSVDAGYSFQVLAHQSRFGLGYQNTDEASAFGPVGALVIDSGLPQNRFLATYMVNVSRWTDVGVAVYHDRDYAVPNSGTGTKATTGLVRLAVKFA